MAMRKPAYYPETTLQGISEKTSGARRRGAETQGCEPLQNGCDHSATRPFGKSASALLSSGRNAFRPNWGHLQLASGKLLLLPEPVLDATSPKTFKQYSVQSHSHVHVCQRARQVVKTLTLLASSLATAHAAKLQRTADSGALAHRVSLLCARG